VIPRRSALSGERGVLITAATSFKQKNNIYIFLQVGRGALHVDSAVACCGGSAAVVLWRHIATAAWLCMRVCAAWPWPGITEPLHLALPCVLAPFLPQSEYGDLYRVSLDYEGEQVKGEHTFIHIVGPRCT